MSHHELLSTLAKKTFQNNLQGRSKRRYVFIVYTLQSVPLLEFLRNSVSCPGQTESYALMSYLELLSYWVKKKTKNASQAKTKKWQISNVEEGMVYPTVATTYDKSHERSDMERVVWQKRAMLLFMRHWFRLVPKKSAVWTVMEATSVTKRYIRNTRQAMTVYGTSVT